MLKISIIFALVAAATSADAFCNTTGSVTLCSDGTSYIQSGNTTFGSNSSTGSNWSQTTVGNNTFGTDSDGNSWNQSRVGNSVFGTDSDGHAYSCIQSYDGTMVCN